MDHENGIYDFTEQLEDRTKVDTLYVCSDLEGGNVFNFNSTNEIYDKDMNAQKIPISKIEGKGMINILNDKTFNEDGTSICMKKNNVENIFIENFQYNKENFKNIIDFKGIITDIIKPTVALAYTGDLFDNRPHSLRLLHAMVNLKETHPKRVIIVGGNRDFNKLRLGMELFVNIREENGIINSNIFDSTITFDELLTKNFEFKMTNIPAYLNHSLWTINPKSTIKIYDEGKEIFDNESSETSSAKIKKRVNFIMKTTMGIPGIAYIKEIKEIFDIIDDDKAYKLVCLLFMAMCFNWPQKFLISNVDKGIIFNSFKGKIYDYLKKMHPVAYFKLGHDGLTKTKTGFLSHSGMLREGITAPLGFRPDQQGISVREFMPKLELDKNNMLKEYNRYINDPIGNIINYENYIRYIAITAPPYKNHSPIIAGPGINSNFNIKVSVGGMRNIIPKNMQIQNIKSPYDNNYLYPKNYMYNKTEMVSLRTDIDAGTVVDYNIFGHIPSFIFPVVTKLELGTKHVGLDICRTDFGGSGQNNYSFALLQINSIGDDFILGRSKFGDVKNTDKRPSMLLDKVVYYYNNIDDFKKIHDNNVINIDKVLPLEFQKKYKLAPKGHDRYIEEIRQDSTEGQTEKSIGTGGKKLSRKRKHKKRTTHKKSKSHKTRKHKRHQHKCTALCKKCHKHDHKCMLKCRLCHQQHKSHKHKRH